MKDLEADQKKAGVTVKNPYGESGEKDPNQYEVNNNTPVTFTGRQNTPQHQVTS